jgi:hypothetical protein
MKVCGKEIRVDGRLIRIGGLAADTYEFVEDPEAVLDAVQKSGVRIDLFSFMQRMPHTSPKYPYPMEWDNLAVLSVSTFDHWWTQQIGFKARNKAKQAEKNGVTLRQVPFDNALVKGIWAIYNECPVRQGKPFAHYGKNIEMVHKEAGTFLDRSIFIGAFLGDRLIGFAKLLCDETRTQAGLVHVLSMVQFKDKAATNALVAQAVRCCATEKIPYLVYSRFNDGGRKQRDSLMDFKERNGFQRIDLPRYFVPLTRIGSTAFRLGLHKRLADRVPEPVLARLRLLRKAWTNRKLQSVPEAS